jgi:hypothetical protein
MMRNDKSFDVLIVLSPETRCRMILPPFSFLLGGEQS